MTSAGKDPMGELSPTEVELNTLREDEDDGRELNPLVADAVGRALQAHFRAIADLPLPDRFIVLLAELEASERSS
jgi:Anti-sigma factor NepR